MVLGELRFAALLKQNLNSKLPKAFCDVHQKYEETNHGTVPRIDI